MTLVYSAIRRIESLPIIDIENVGMYPLDTRKR
jgi:hypothetical protein